MFNGLFGWLSSDIGIDLGTANTLVYVKDQGIVLREPSVVAVQAGTNRVLAVGDEAKRMLGRTPANIVAVRPLKDGVIADFEVTEAMLRHFISKVHNRRVRARPRVVIAVPSGITEVEKRAVRESATHAGAREVYLIEEPMAAAIGVGLPVQDPAGNMIIDIGGGTTEVALISLSGIVFSRSVRVAGDELDEAIVQYMKRAYNLMVGERTAEEIKIKIGSAYPSEKETSVEVKGRDLVAGLPKTLMITSQEVREALLEPISTIVDSVRITLERCPPELSADLVDRGLVLVGGGALLLMFDGILGYFLSFGPETTQKFKVSIYRLLAPFLTGGSGIKKQITSVRSGLRSLDELEHENAALQVENRELRATNHGLRDVEHEVNRLRHALNYRERSVFKLIAAEIVARDSSTWWRTVTINRGRRDGVETDMPVVTDEGLIGKTTTVSDSISVVLLVSDENCRVASSVEGSREQGIVSGERVTTGLTPLLDLNFLSKQADLKPGQKVYTSGVGGVFPSGLLIGVVKSFRVRELDGQAQLTSAVDLSHLEDVFVVTGRR